MFRKIIDNVGYIGFVALFAALVYYSVYKLWDWKTQALTYGGLVLILVYLAANLPKIRGVFRSRAVRYGGTAGVTVLLVFGILILANFLNFQHHKRIDLTENQILSLSEQSQKVVANLSTEVEIIGFFTAEPDRQRFEQLMEQYRYESSNVEYQVVDPQQEPAKAQQYEIQRDGQVAVLSGTKKETVDSFDEEKITNAIIKVTREEEKTVYFLEGHGEWDIESSEPDGLSVAKEAIETQNYVVQAYNLAQQNQLPENATVIASVGPKVNFFPNEVELLKQYLASGGKFLLMVDPQTDFSMNDFLTDYGLALSGKIVVDASGLGQIFGYGPAFPLVADYADHPITRELQRVMTFYPMAQNVQTNDSPLGYTTVELLKTSEASWAESNIRNGRVALDSEEDEKGPVTLAAIATHSVQTAEEEGEQAAENGAEDPEETGGKESRFVLFGDSDFASNAYFNSTSNGDVFLMSVSWLAEEMDLVAVRPKDPENRRIDLTVSQIRLVFWGAVVLLPLATLVLGLSVWYRRR